MELSGRDGAADAPVPGPSPAGAAAPAGGRPYLRLWFECSGRYARAYKAPDGTVYLGRCPRCGAAARFPVGEGGVSERFFRVSCR